jgi:hypothetical protein
MGPGLSAREQPESQGRQDKQRPVVAQQRGQQGDEIQLRVGDDDPRQEVHPALRDRREGAVSGDLGQERARKPEAGEKPVEEKGRGRGAQSTHRESDRPSCPAGTSREQAVHENE